MPGPLGKLPIIARNLRGHARKFYHEEQSRDHSWRTLKELFFRQFKKPVPFGRLLREAASYSARPGQKLGDYCFEKLTRLRALKVEIPDAYLEDAIIVGIGDEQIERTVRSNRYKDVHELYATMNEMGTMPQVTTTKTSTFRFNTRQRGAASGQEGAAPATTTRPSMNSTPREEPQRSTITCFNCGQDGHTSRRSKKKPIICRACQTQGQLEKFCYRTKKINNTQKAT